jgi:hypothetical protein
VVSIEEAESAGGAIERIAREICKADGCDPDQITVGVGGCMPLGYKYPLWKARIRQAQMVHTLLTEVYGLTITG